MDKIQCWQNEGDENGLWFYLSVLDIRPWNYNGGPQHKPNAHIHIHIHMRNALQTCQAMPCMHTCDSLNICDKQRSIIDLATVPVMRF